jgi:hypothetical protein
LQGHIAEVQKLPTVTLLDEPVLQAVVLEVIVEMVAQQPQQGKLALVLQVAGLPGEVLLLVDILRLPVAVAVAVLEF